MLDSTRLNAELMHIHRALSEVAASAPGKGLIDDLRREIEGTTGAILWQALFADCLRVVHSATAADDVIADHEIEALYEFLYSVARHYAGVLPASYGEFVAIDERAVRPFLNRYAADSGPFGQRATLHWPGLMLCRRAAELGQHEALERYEQMMRWLLDVACQIGGVSTAGLRWRGRISDIEELRRALVNLGHGTSANVDLRMQAFLSKTRVFTPVQQASSVFDADPFDVETVHASARRSFAELVNRVTSPSERLGRGGMLLMLGDSGAGKTHVVRAFRHHVHEYGRGFVTYAQLNSNSDDYARYLLQHVVDSLSRPYAGPTGERTGMVELASGLARLVCEPLKSQIQQLAEGKWEATGVTNTFTKYVNSLVDDLLQQADLGSFEPDLLRVLLYALYPDQRVTSRAYKYLRCLDMSDQDRAWLGNVVPRVGKDDPRWMIRDLARLAFATRRAVFVLIIDQAERAGFEAATAGAVFRRAIDTLQSIVSEAPSAIAVVACLSDLYKAVRGELTKAAIDRLENETPPERLDLNRSYPEIEAIVARRLSWLFAEAGAVYRPETPVYPIPEPYLRNLVNRRTRDVLAWCHRFQARCAAAGKLLEATEPDSDRRHGHSGHDRLAHDHPAHDHPAHDDLDQIAIAWNDAVHAPAIEVPDSDDGILTAVEVAARACAEETGLSLASAVRRKGILRVALASEKERAELAIAITNRRPQAGAFGEQIATLRRSARIATPVAIRTIEFPHGVASAKAMAQLAKAGGRRACIDASTLRALTAFQRFQPAFPAARIAAWRRRDRPISTLPLMAHIFDLDRLSAPPVDPANESTPPTPSQAPPTPEPAPASSDRGTGSRRRSARADTSSHSRRGLTPE